MKIGIITLSGGENYGCHLQMYAVLKTYEELGYTPMLIPDNTNNGIKFSYQERSRLSKLTPAYITAVLRVRTKRKYLIKNQRDRFIPSVVRKKRNAALYAKSKKIRSENFNEFQNSYIKQTDFRPIRQFLGIHKVLFSAYLSQKTQFGSIPGVASVNSES